ncbi:MAG TPA: response regulator transcription factor [Rhodopila sp.]|jgi:DNA-binding NarL/FixJ family response regulator|nr:response regulator transcription factor [Rhodopila sp.]
MDGILAGGVGSPGTTALIAARQTLFRLGLVGILRDHHAHWHLVEADTFQAALDLPMANAPDVVLLDEHLPDLHCFEGLQRIRAMFPQAKVLVLAGIDERDRMLDLIDAGAHGCLTTSASPLQVLAAFNSVLCGGVFIPASAREPVHVTQRSVPTSGFSIGSLTGRQREVFDLMARGYSTKLIARELGLAVGTVKVHLAAIYRLLGAHNRTEAVARLVNGGSPAEQSGPGADLSVMFSDLGWNP